MQLSFFFFNDPPITDIYTLSLHDALPIYCRVIQAERMGEGDCAINLHAVAHPEAPHGAGKVAKAIGREQERSEEHTSELQSHSDLVCRLLLEKKNQIAINIKLIYQEATNK